MPRTFLTLAVLILGALASPGRAHAQTLKASYEASLAGLPLGVADLTATFDGQKYTLQFVVKLTGLAKVLTGGKGAGTASGVMAAIHPRSAVFAASAHSSGADQSVRMTLADGNVSTVDINPPLEDKPDRVPVKDADKQDVVDPLSALLMPLSRGKKPEDPANCNRVLPVFDGGSRFNIVLSYGETKEADTEGYKGKVLVCNVRYVPISGHRSLRPSTKFMQDNKEMTVWLASLESLKILVPVRISVRTMIGTSVVEATNWSLSKDKSQIPAPKDPSQEP